jgi:hypothetical protein
LADTWSFSDKSGIDHPKKSASEVLMKTCWSSHSRLLGYLPTFQIIRLLAIVLKAANNKAALGYGKKSAEILPKKMEIKRLIRELRD